VSNPNYQGWRRGLCLGCGYVYPYAQLPGAVHLAPCTACWKAAREHRCGLCGTTDPAAAIGSDGLCAGCAEPLQSAGQVLAAYTVACSLCRSEHKEYGSVVPIPALDICADCLIGRQSVEVLASTDLQSSPLHLAPHETSCGRCGSPVGVLVVREFVGSVHPAPDKPLRCPRCTCRVCRSKAVDLTSWQAGVQVCRSCLGPTQVGHDERDPLYAIPCAHCAEPALRCARELQASGTGHWPTIECAVCGHAQSYHVAAASDPTCRACNEPFDWDDELENAYWSDEDDDDEPEIISLEELCDRI
jgi:hypothetical protein